MTTAKDFKNSINMALRCHNMIWLQKISSRGSKYVYCEASINIFTVNVIYWLHSIPKDTQWLIFTWQYNDYETCQSQSKTYLENISLGMVCHRTQESSKLLRTWRFSKTLRLRRCFVLILLLWCGWGRWQ